MVLIIVNLMMLLLSGFFFLKYSDPIILALSFLAIVNLTSGLLTRRSKRRSADQQGKNLTDQNSADLNTRLSAAEEKNRSMREQLEKLTDTEKRNRSTLSSLADSVSLLNAAAPVLEALTKRVVEKAETSNMSVSDRIFSIAEHSKFLSSEIQKVLTDLMDGSGGLENSLARLEQETGSYKSLVTGLKEVSNGYLKDLEFLKQAVEKIGSYTQGLTDLADQTNLLSINASIEAARAGSAGGGFRIIASEVQDLAKRSKTIADEINTQIVTAADNVENSFSQQEVILSKSIHRIEESQGNLDKLVTELRPQIESIGSTVEESKEVSNGVTEDLNEIIVSMQYHDMIRQILEHCNSIFNELRLSCGDENLLSEYAGKDEEYFQKRVREISTKYFTVDDEWEVLGMSVRDNTQRTEQERLKKEHKLEGDITLF